MFCLPMPGPASTVAMHGIISAVKKHDNLQRSTLTKGHMKKDLLRHLHTDTGLQAQRLACSKVYSNRATPISLHTLHTQQHKREKHLKSNWTDRTVTGL